MNLGSALKAESFVATEAILLYRQVNGGGKGFATVHGVQMEGARPVIQAGKLLGTEDMACLMMQVMPSRRISFIDEKVIGLSEEDMVWWVPPSEQMMWFNTDGKDGLGMVGGRCWQPGLVFTAGECGWRVFAVKGGTRPGRDAALFQAPYYNVNGSGHICAGNVDVPREIGVGYIEEFERAFFGSRFTHANVHVKRHLTKYKGGAGALWAKMIHGKAKKFPESSLVPAKMTLGGLVAKIAERYE